MRLQVGREACDPSIADGIHDKRRIAGFAKREQRLATDRRETIVAEHVGPFGCESRQDRMLRHVGFRMDAFRRLHAVVVPIDLDRQELGEWRVGIVRLAVEAAERHPPADHREPAASAHIVADHSRDDSA